MDHLRRIAPLVALAAVLACCGESKPENGAGREPGADAKPLPKNQPDRVLIDQILISFDKSRLTHPRQEAEAAALAKSLFARIRGGADYGLLKKKSTDYRLPENRKAADPVWACNRGIRIRSFKEVPFKNLWPGWAKVVFALKPGELGFVPYDKKKAGDGYHIVLRLR